MPARSGRWRSHAASVQPTSLTGEKKPVDPRKAAAEEEARRKKAELEKPRIVVDVYRGDKHVQESFR